MDEIKIYAFSVGLSCMLRKYTKFLKISDSKEITESYLASQQKAQLK